MWQMITPNICSTIAYSLISGYQNNKDGFQTGKMVEWKFYEWVSICSNDGQGKREIWKYFMYRCNICDTKPALFGVSLFRSYHYSYAIWITGDTSPQNIKLYAGLFININTDIN